MNETIVNQPLLKNVKRSSKWPGVMHKFLKDHPACEVCGKTDAVNVHHVFPFDYAINLDFPSLELLIENLVTLCETESGKPEENHHLEIGHGGRFADCNLQVREDIKKYKDMTHQQILESSDYQLEIKTTILPPFHEITEEQKKTLIDWIKKTYPNLPEFQK